MEILDITFKTKPNFINCCCCFPCELYFLLFGKFSFYANVHCLCSVLLYAKICFCFFMFALAPQHSAEWFLPIVTISKMIKKGVNYKIELLSN